MTAHESFHNFARGTSRFALRPIVPVAVVHDVDLVARRLRIVPVVDGPDRDLRRLAHGLILRRWMLAGNRVDNAPYQVVTSLGPFVAPRSRDVGRGGLNTTESKGSSEWTASPRTYFFGRLSRYRAATLSSQASDLGEKSRSGR